MYIHVYVYVFRLRLVVLHCNYALNKGHAWWGERNWEYKEESGDRENDNRRLWHTTRHFTGLCAPRYHSRIASALESYTTKSMCLLQIGNLAYGSVLLSNLVVLDIEKDPFIASPTWSRFSLWYTMLGICLYCLSSWIVWKFLLAKISVSRILYLMLIMKAVIIEALQYTLDFSICTNLLTFHGRYAVTSWQWQEEWRIETRKFQLNIQGQRSTKKGVPLYSSPADSNSAVQWTTTSSQGTMNATIYLRVFPMYLITKMCLCQGG